MAGSKKSAKSVAEIEAELAASIEHTKKLRAEKKKALDEEKDAGRPVLMKALGKVKIGTMRDSDATAIAKAISKLGGSQVAEKLATNSV